MPYIPCEERRLIQKDLDKFVDKLWKFVFDENGELRSGRMNFVLSYIVWKVFSKKRCYDRAERLEGCLSCVSKEFYRRQVAPYEDQKKDYHGDIQI